MEVVVVLPLNVSMTTFFARLIEEKVELLWSLDRHHCVAHYSSCIKGIITKLGIVAHHDKINLQDKGNNSESYRFGAGT